MRPGTGAALAHSNIAFSKYWGKRPYPGNYPATPSLSVTLDALTTRTRVTFDPRLQSDAFVLGDTPQSGSTLARVERLLDTLRAETGVGVFAEVVSKSDFPASSGLASSASGFAALAVAAVAALGLDWDPSRVSDLARRSSASAARSVYGGFVELPAGPEAATSETLPARSLAGPSHVDWRVLVVVAGDGPKRVGSTPGMVETARSSPYYDAWLSAAPRLHTELVDALSAKDLARFGIASERSALAMHASAIAAGVVYFGAVTLEALARVRALRDHGIPAFATMDAGPHVKVLTSAEHASRVNEAVRTIPGVTRVLEARPAEGARAIDPAELW